MGSTSLLDSKTPCARHARHLVFCYLCSWAATVLLRRKAFLLRLSNVHLTMKVAKFKYGCR